MERIEPTAQARRWARMLKERIPDDVSIFSYLDEAQTHQVDVLSGVAGGDSHFAATIGLSRVVQKQSGDIPVATEILLERIGSDANLGNIASTIASYCIKDGWRIAPGTIFEEMVRIYEPATTLPHVMFVPIYQWDDMGEVDLDGLTIYPLLAVPISEAESAFVARLGEQALEDRWEDMDVADWSRASSV